MGRGGRTSKARRESDEAGAEVRVPRALWPRSTADRALPPPPAPACWTEGRRAAEGLRGKAGPLRQGARFGPAEHAPRSLVPTEGGSRGATATGPSVAGHGVRLFFPRVGGLRGGLRTPGGEGGLRAAAKLRGASTAQARQDLLGVAGRALRFPGTRAPGSRRRPSPQPRGGSDTQRPCREVQAPPLGSRREGRRLSRFPLVVTSGHPQERRPRSADCPAGHFPFPSPSFLPGSRPSAGRSCGAAVPGRAGRGAAAALGCDPEQFHFWILPGCDGRASGVGVEGGDTQACRGPGLGTPGEGWLFTPGVSRAPRLPAFSTDPPPRRGFHSAVTGAAAPPQQPPPPRGLPTPGEAPSGVGGRRSEL